MSADPQARVDRFVAYWLDHLELRTTGRDPKLNAHAFAAVPDWALRQLREPLDDGAAQQSPHSLQPQSIRPKEYPPPTRPEEPAIHTEKNDGE